MNRYVYFRERELNEGMNEWMGLVSECGCDVELSWAREKGEMYI